MGIDSMILEWPNIDLTYYDQKTGGFGTIPEIEKRKWGYRLTVGQKLSRIRYRESNRGIYILPTVKEIREDGLVVTHLLGKGEVFVPFVQLLLGVGGSCYRDMYIEPCEPLFEKNKMVDIVSGNITTEEVGRKSTQCGIWYKHGGWRTKHKQSDENLKHFVKLGQVSMEELM